MTIDEMIHRVISLQHEASERGELALWTVYDHPLDFPDKFVARMFVAGNGACAATEHLLTSGDLEKLYDILWKAGLTLMAPDKKDDPKILATWI